MGREYVIKGYAEGIENREWAGIREGIVGWWRKGIEDRERSGKGR
jgi:hypothetical protein